MTRKRKGFFPALLACLIILAMSQAAAAALTAVGPTNPDNGFPLWYRSSTGQTVTLSVPPNAVSIPDPPIPGNAFSQQIGFGTEAMYWHSTATIDPLPAPAGGGRALLVLALEAAFAAEEAIDGDQIVFARVRIRIDTDIPGTYTVTHPYGTRTFNVDAADVGTRAINFTSDIGIGAPGDFRGALRGAIDPFLVQDGAPAGTLGDAATETTVTGSPTGNNFFRIEGPPGFGTVTQPLFVTGAELFAGTPFIVNRATFSRDALGNASAEIFAEAPAPFTPGTGIRVSIPGQPGERMTRSGRRYFARVPFAAPFTPNIDVRGNILGDNTTIWPVTLRDVVTITTATYTVSTQELNVAAVSSDEQATLTARWIGSGGLQALAPGGAATNFPGIPIAPRLVTVRSSSGGMARMDTVILP